jgi:DNA-binding response OmpR family regulator
MTCRGCKVLVFDPQPKYSDGAADALETIGFRRIDSTGCPKTLELASAGGEYDLLVGDAGGIDGGIGNLVRRLRHNALGRNPFLGVILTTRSATPDRVRDVLSTGTDHLLVKPFTTGQIHSRIKAIADDRKPFVVTVDYIGPDRRGGFSRASGVARIAVPNSLRAKARNDPTVAATPESIAAAITIINHQKIARYDLQIGILVAMIVRSFEAGQPRVGRTARFKRVLYLITDLITRVRGTEFGGASSICAELVRQIHDISQRAEPTPDQLSVLMRTSMALHRCFQPHRTEAQITDIVTDALTLIERRDPAEIASSTNESMKRPSRHARA